MKQAVLLSIKPKWVGLIASGKKIVEIRKTRPVGHFVTLQKTNPKETILNTYGLEDDKTYKVDVVPVEHNIKDFGGLINMILPIHVNPNGWFVNFMSKRITMPGEKESYTVYGSVLNNKGLILNPEWTASGFNEGVRVLKDFGSRLYLVNQDETH